MLSEPKLRRIFSKTLVSFLLALMAIPSVAQPKFWVVFKDKTQANFDPISYFDPLAIERRIRAGLALCDESDFPVNQSYIDQVSALVDSTGYASRWFNMLSVYASEEQCEQIAMLPFVQEILPQTGQFHTTGTPSKSIENEAASSLIQTERFGPSAFFSKGFHGQGLRIAVLDAGFSEVNTHPAFQKLRDENRIIQTWDFIRKDPFVYGFGSHGRAVLSCITGQKGDSLLGLATRAEFLLARTEYSRTEPFSEEEFWLAASEWADKNGAHIINSSLGYTKDRYFPWKMDGKTSFVVRAANKAASKGILVVNSAGNEGDSDWRYIGTPADADSVLSVGGLNPETDLRISYSSFGPTADRRLKPNVTAISHVLAAEAKDYGMSDGTSFSSPLVAGFAACAWQSQPNLTNMQLFREIEKSGDLAPYFDYAHGYGVPQASWFTEKTHPQPEIRFELRQNGDTITVFVPSVPKLENDGPENNWPSNRYLYYHIQNSRGFLDKYAVLMVEQNQVVFFTRDELQGRTLRVSFQGAMKEFKF